MLCNQNEYIVESKIIRRTWGKEILSGGAYSDNMQLWFFTASQNGQEYIDEENNTIYVSCNDSLLGTGEKMKNAFRIVVNSFDFDYVIITNTRTVLNIKLIDRFVNSEYCNEELFYGGEFIFQVKRIPFFRGDFIMLSKKNVIRVNDAYDKVDFNKTFENDVSIFDSLSTYYSYCDFLKQFRLIESIGKYEKEFSFENIGKNFYINTKFSNHPFENVNIYIPLIVGTTSLLLSDRKEYDLKELVREVDVVETHAGRFKIEKID